MLLRRSNLIMPVIRQDFVEKAWSRAADAVTLDLEDSVPDSKKEIARGLIQISVRQIAKGGSDVLIRVNNEKHSLVADLESAVLSGVRGIILPKVESVENVKSVDQSIAKLELERNLPRMKFTIGIVIESAKGIMNALDIAAASKRIESISVGFEDFSRDLGIDQPNSDVFTHALYHIVVVARAAEITPLGLAGSVADLNPETFRESAIRSKNLGIRGAMAINPLQVSVLNEVFSPTEAEVLESRRIVETYETGLSRDSGAMKLNNKMIDKPVYLKAKSVIDYSTAINELERKSSKSASFDN